jgi:spore photoproduct lyase
MAEGTKQTLLDVTTIYHEPDVPDYPRGRAILDRFPAAERIVVPSHWNIPELHRNEALAEEWNRVKRTVLVLGAKKGLRVTPYERSADFVAPSTANGCAMACAYCYVARRKGYANPITVFVNIEQIGAAIERHAGRQGPKPAPTGADPALWVYELGTNSDGAVDATISDNIRDLVALFRRLPHAKATFSTKYVNRDLLDYDPQGKTRLRISLMPPDVARVVDVRTSPVPERIAAINDFVAAGYEVNVNFAPVIWYDGWLDDWARLFDRLDDTLSPAAKAGLAAEVIFLTHNEELHEVNLRWHPKAEEWLWQPDFQEEKVSGGGGRNLRYRLDIKRGLVAQFRQLLGERLPYCRIRYAF